MMGFASLYPSYKSAKEYNKTNTGFLLDFTFRSIHSKLYPSVGWVERSETHQAF